MVTPPLTSLLLLEPRNSATSWGPGTSPSIHGEHSDTARPGPDAEGRVRPRLASHPAGLPLAARVRSVCPLAGEGGAHLPQGDSKAFLLTRSPLPRIPPKYQTSSERCSLLSITFPLGKNNRMFARTPNTMRGMRVPPRHLAQPPVHMLRKDGARLGKLSLTASGPGCPHRHRPEPPGQCPPPSPSGSREAQRL